MESLSQSYSTVICVAASVLILLLYSISTNLWKRSTRSKARLAPEPDGAWPLIGHLRLLFEPNLPHQVLGVLADKYGAAFTIRLGLHKALVINNWEVAKECFTINDRVLATRPSSVAVKLMGYNYAIFGFAPYGSYWREIRKIAVVELLSNQRLDLLKDVRVSEVNMAIKELYKTSKDSYAVVDMKHWFSDLSLNLIVRMVAGKRYFGPNQPNNSEGKQLLKSVNDFFHLVGVFVLSDLVPLLGWLDLQGYEKAMRRNAQQIDSIMERWLEEHKRKKIDGGAKTEHDFMDVMLSVLEDNKLSEYGYDVDVINKATCFTMILGGADTITVTMTWALSLLLNNQYTMKKAQDEIDTMVGKDRHVCVQDIEKLVYLQAIVKETLRLYPGVPLSAQHEATRDCTVAGYHVPAGTRLITNIWKIQRDPRVWSSPSEFQPERFLTAQASIDLRGQNFEFIPFGSGRRSCPGASFALQVVQLALARLLQGFDFKTPTNEAVDMTESTGLTNLKATPLEVLITPRLSSDMY